MRKLLIALALLLPVVQPMLTSAQVKDYFGATPDLKVSGKEFVDPEGRAVTLHGVMDTPNDYFNGGRWNDGTLGWPVYNNTRSVQLCRDYFTKVFQAIANPAKGSYCNLFRLHLDPAWTNDPNKQATGSGSENDISRFSADRLRKYMDELYVPIAEDALAHGLYIIMRPPGVFPEDVTVGDAYNKYLLTVWDIVSSNEWVKEHAGQVMLELGNEPVRMSGHLADYFQPIVNKIRDNGFTGILLLPGTSYQANYTDYKTKAIVDTNYGYAVHNYPGWYGGWDANQTEASFIATFEAQVPVDQKPIVITEVDWSPMKQGAGHWNEMHTQYTEGNFGTWGTGTTHSPAPNVAYRNTQNVGWGTRFRHLVDKHPNISWTLQGTSTYVDMDTYLMDGTVQPAFSDQMKDAGYTDAREACSGACFDWYYEYACGDRLPKGEVNVLPEVPITPTYKTDATVTGNAFFDKTNAHYCFYTSTYSSFTFGRFSGTKLAECASLSIGLGDESTIGYRLDVQLKDKDGHIIKDGSNDFIIGTEARGTRFTAPESRTYDMQEIFGSYLTQYPGCTIGDIRLNTVVSSEDTGRTGKYFFTLKEMKMETGVITARHPVAYEEKPLSALKTMTYDETRDYVCDNPTNCGGWGATSIEYKDGTGKDGAGYEIVNSTKKNPWEAQFCIESSTGYVNGQEYVLLLDIKGSVTGSISAGIQNPDGYKGCGNFPAITITEAWKTVGVKALVTGEGAKRILLDVGDYVGTINIDNIRIYTVTNTTPRESGAQEYTLTLGSQVNAGGLVYGTSTVAHNIYADLSAYSKITLRGSGSQVRLLFNREVPEGATVEKSVDLTSNNGEATIDLATLDNKGYVHLHAIKSGWSGGCNVSEILLTNEGNPDDIADYYIEGKGVQSEGVQNALSDVSATVIDLTGYTGTIENSFASANPNCLLLYGEGNKVGSPYGTRNLVKTDNSAYRITLTDGYDFRAPMDIATAAQRFDSDRPYGASYIRELHNAWATMPLPFALDVTYLGTPAVFVLQGVSADAMVLRQITEGTIAAGSVILYYNPELGPTTLYGSNVSRTDEGLNIQPVAGVDGWYTAQSYRHRVIDDVTTDDVLKDYDVYAIVEDQFVHVTRKLTINPFRSFFLTPKSQNARPRLGIRIAVNEEEGIETVAQEAVTESARFDAAGRRIHGRTSGLSIIRYSDGSVQRRWSVNN